MTEEELLAIVEKVTTGSESERLLREILLELQGIRHELDMMRMNR